MTNIVSDSAIETALNKVAKRRPDLLPEHNAGTLVFYPSKKKGHLSRSYFALFSRDGRYWVRCQGVGDSREYQGPATAHITEEWVITEATNFIESTERGFGLNP
jgi:hypothetical protein